MISIVVLKRSCLHCFLFLFSRAEWFISIAANGALGFLVRREAPEFFFTLLSF